MRMVASVLIGLLASAFGIARLALLGWLIAKVFQGATLPELLVPMAIVAGVMLARGMLEYFRTMIAHVTAARVQLQVRKTIYDKSVALGPAYFGQQKSADVMLAVVDSVEQLETYFGQFLPQLVISVVTPIAVFGFVGFLDLPVAAVLVGATLFTLIAPMMFQKLDRVASRGRGQALRAFSAEFVDAVQGLATLKAFGQASTRARDLGARAIALSTNTMKVNAVNALGRGITDTGIAIGAAAALGVGAYRVVDGAMAIETLLIVLMMGVELFRPLRDLRQQLHTGMLGQSAAETIFRLLDADPIVKEAGGNAAGVLQPAISFADVDFTYPGADAPVYNGLDFDVAAGERIGVVGTSGAGKSTIVRLLLRHYDPDGGRITVGGRDLRDLRFDVLRSCLQSSTRTRTSSTARLPTTCASGRPQADQTQLIQAARAANAHDFIEPCLRATPPSSASAACAVRRATPAHRHRPRAAARCADPRARRGPFCGRRRERGGDPGRRSTG